MAGIRANFDVDANTAPAVKSMQRAAAEINKITNNISGKGVNFNVNSKSFTQPLGRITASANEFTKSLEASNARVIAFGASVGIINGVTDSFKFLVAETIRFEKTLKDINVVLNSSNQQLQQFGQGLFDVAQNTAQSFNVAADAALEFSRQGLSTAEVLKRTNDALTLTRITSLDAAEAVSGLTAAVNAFGKAGLTTTDIIDKLAAVDVKFAVSSEDLINGLERAGAVAIDAGVSLDSLVGIITSLQQTTARGGAVIGNGLKTIFTRIQRPESIRQLEAMDVAVRDLTGSILPADTILKNIARSFKNLSQAQQSNIVQFSAGIFQANIFRAALTDLAKAQGIQEQALSISANAAGEAARKNELLNKSISALASRAGTGLQELAGIIGDLTIKEDLGGFLNLFANSIEGLKKSLGGGEDEGSSFAKGLVRGIGNVLTGPGMIAFTVIFTKLLANVFKFAGSSLKDVMGIVSEKEKVKKIEESILKVLGENRDLTQALNNLSDDRVAQEKFVLGMIERQTNALAEQQKLAQRLARPLARRGINEDLSFDADGLVDLDGDGSTNSFASYGVSPEARKRERKGAAAGGYAAGPISKTKIPGLGDVVYNKAETIKQFPGMKQPAIMPPERSKAGQNYKRSFVDKHGFDPYAVGGFVPNFSSITNDMTRPGPQGMKLFVSPGYTIKGRSPNKDWDPNSGMASFSVKTSNLKNSNWHNLGDYLEALGVSTIDTKIPLDYWNVPTNKKGRMTPEAKRILGGRDANLKGEYAEGIHSQSEKAAGMRSTSAYDKAVVDNIGYGMAPHEVKAVDVKPENILQKSLLRYSNDSFRSAVRDIASSFMNNMEESPGLGMKKSEIAREMIHSISKIEEDIIVKSLSTLAKMNEFSLPGMSNAETQTMMMQGRFRDAVKSAGPQNMSNFKNLISGVGLSGGLVPNYAATDGDVDKYKKFVEELWSMSQKGKTLNQSIVSKISKDYFTGTKKGISDVAIGRNIMGKGRHDRNEGQNTLYNRLQERFQKEGSKKMQEVQDAIIKGRNIDPVYHGTGLPPDMIQWKLGETKQLNYSLSDMWSKSGGKALNPQSRLPGGAFSDTLITNKGAGKAIRGWRKNGFDPLAALSSNQYSGTAKIYLPYMNGEKLTSKAVIRSGLEGEGFERLIKMSAKNLAGTMTGSKSPLDFLGPDGEAKITSYGAKNNFPWESILAKMLRSKVGNNQNNFSNSKAYQKAFASGNLGSINFFQPFSQGLIPNFASTTLYRGTSPKYDKAVRDIPNPPQFLFDEIMAAKTKSDFIKAVKKLGIAHSMGAYSGSYNDGMYAATIEQMRGHEEMDENQILHGGYVYPRPIRGGFGKQEGVDLTPRHQPSGFVSRTVDEDVAKDFAKSMHPGYEYNPNFMGDVDEVSVPNTRIFDQTKIEKYIDRFGLENVKRSFKEGMRKGTLKDIYLNLHKFRPKVQSTDPLDMFSPNAGEAERSIGMSSGSLTRDEKEITHIWSKRSPYFGSNKGLVPNFVRYDKSRGGAETWEAIPDNRVGKYGGVFTAAEVEKMRNDGWARTDKKGWHFVGGGRAGVDRVEKGEREARRKLLEAQGMMRGGGKMIINNETGEMFHGMDHQQIAQENNLYDNGGLPFHFLKTHMGTKLFDSRADGGKGGYARKMFVSLREKTINPSVLSKLKNIAEENAMVLLRDDSYSRNREGDILYDSRGVLGETILSRGFVPNFYNLNRRNLSDGDKMSDRQRLLMMWQDKMGEIRPYAEQIKKGGARADIDPIISRKNAEANEIWDQLQLLKAGKDYFIPNFNVNLSNGYHGKEAIGKAIGKVYKSKTGMAMKRQDLDFAIERYIAAINDDQADDGPNFISNYPGGNFTIGGQRFNFNEISMALLGHGQFHKSFKSEGLIPNFAQKIRNGAIYHSKINNKAVRVKRAHQAEQIAYIKHHKQDHMFESEVPFSDLITATPEQIKEYMTRKSAGFVPNFSSALYKAIEREKDAGVPEGRIRISQDDRLIGSKNPMGLAVINTRDEPLGIGQGIRRAKEMGIDPKSHGASQGLVPNFADPVNLDETRKSLVSNLKKIEKSFGNLNMITRIFKGLDTDDVSSIEQAIDKTSDLIGHLQEGISNLETKAQSSPLTQAEEKQLSGNKGNLEKLKKTKENLEGAKAVASVKTTDDFDEHLEKLINAINQRLKEIEQSGDPGAQNEHKKLIQERNEALIKEKQLTEESADAKKGDISRLFFMSSMIQMVNGQFQELATSSSEVVANFGKLGESAGNIVQAQIAQKEITAQLGETMGVGDDQSVSVTDLFSGKSKAKKKAFDKAEMERARKAGPAKGLGRLLGPIGKVGRIFTRFVPIVGQLYTGFTVVNELFKNFGHFFGLEKGAGVMDLFASGADKAAQRLEKLGKMSEAASSALESIDKASTARTKVAELEHLGSSRTLKQDTELIKSKIELMKADRASAQALQDLSNKQKVGEAGVEMFTRVMKDATDQGIGLKQALEQSIFSLQGFSAIAQLEKGFAEGMDKMGDRENEADDQKDMDVFAEAHARNLAQLISPVLQNKIEEQKLEGAVSELANRIKNVTDDNINNLNLKGIAGIDDGLASSLEQVIRGFERSARDEDEFGASGEKAFNKAISALADGIRKGTVKDEKEIALIQSTGDARKELERRIVLGKALRKMEQKELDTKSALLKLSNKRIAFENQLLQEAGGLSTSESIIRDTKLKLLDLEIDSSKKRRDAESKLTESLLDQVQKSLRVENLTDMDGASMQKALKDLTKSYRNASMELDSADIVKNINEGLGPNMAIDPTGQDIATARSILNALGDSAAEAQKNNNPKELQSFLNETYEKLEKASNSMVNILVQSALGLSNAIPLTEENFVKMREVLIEREKTLHSIKEENKVKNKEIRDAEFQAGITKKTLQGAIDRKSILDNIQLTEQTILDNLQGEAANQKVQNDFSSKSAEFRKKSAAYQAMIFEQLRGEFQKNLVSEEDNGEKLAQTIMLRRLRRDRDSVKNPAIGEAVDNLTKLDALKVEAEVDNLEKARLEAQDRNSLLAIFNQRIRMAGETFKTEKANQENEILNNYYSEELLKNKDLRRDAAQRALMLELQALEKENRLLDGKIELMEDVNYRTFISKAQVGSELKQLKYNNMLEKAKLEYAMHSGKLAEISSETVKSEIIALEKEAISAKLKDEALVNEKGLLARQTKAQNLLDAQNKLIEARNAQIAASVSQEHLSAMVGADMEIERAQRTLGVRSAATRADISGRPEDILAFTEQFKELNETTGKGTGAIDQLRVKMAEMSVSASNLGADLVNTGIEGARSGMVDLFKSIGTGAENASEAWKKFTLGIAESILDRMMQHHVDKIINDLTFAFTGVDPAKDKDKFLRENNRQLELNTEKLSELIKKYADDSEKGIDKPAGDPQEINRLMQDNISNLLKSHEETLKSSQDIINQAKPRLIQSTEGLMQSIIASMDNVSSQLGEVKKQQDIKTLNLTIEKSKNYASSIYSALHQGVHDFSKNEAKTRQQDEIQELNAKKLALEKQLEASLNRKKGNDKFSGFSTDYDSMSLSGIQEAGFFEPDYDEMRPKLLAFDKALQDSLEKVSKQKFEGIEGMESLPKNTKFGTMKPGHWVMDSPETGELRFSDGRGGFNERSVNTFMATTEQDAREAAKSLGVGEQLAKVYQAVARDIKQQVEQYQNNNQGALSSNNISPSEIRAEIKLLNDELRKAQQNLDIINGKLRISSDGRVYSPMTAAPDNKQFWGGRIQKFAEGGFVNGPAGKDQVPAMLTAGEYVVPKDEAQKFNKGTGRKGAQDTDNWYERGMMGWNREYSSNRGTALFQGIGRAAVMTASAQAMSRSMNKNLDKPPTFNVKKFDQLNLGSDVSLKRGDSRLSAKALAKDPVMEEYRGYLMDKAAYTVKKKNEKFQDRMGILNAVMSTFTTFMTSEAVNALSVPLSKAVDFAKTKAQNAVMGHAGFGDKAEQFKSGRRQGLKFDYKDISKTVDKQGNKSFQINNVRRRKNIFGIEQYDSKGEPIHDGSVYEQDQLGKWNSSSAQKQKYEAKQEKARMKAVRKRLKSKGYDVNSELWSTGISPKDAKAKLKRNSGGSIPAMLTAGEGFIPAPIAKRIGYENLDAMNRTGSLPTIKGPGGIDNVGPVGLSEGDFIIRKSSTDKLMRENPNMMRFAMQNPDGFRKGETGYYEGGIVGTEGTSSVSMPSSGASTAGQPINRIQPLMEAAEAQQKEKVTHSQNNEVTNNINVNVTIDSSGNETVEASSPQGSYEQEQELAMKIKSKVLEVIREEKRLGGELDK